MPRILMTQNEGYTTVYQHLLNIVLAYITMMLFCCFFFVQLLFAVVTISCVIEKMLKDHDDLEEGFGWFYLLFQFISLFYKIHMNVGFDLISVSFRFVCFSQYPSIPFTLAFKFMSQISKSCTPSHIELDPLLCVVCCVTCVNRVQIYELLCFSKVTALNAYFDSFFLVLFFFVFDHSSPLILYHIVVYDIARLKCIQFWLFFCLFLFLFCILTNDKIKFHILCAKREDAFSHDANNNCNNK